MGTVPVGTMLTANIPLLNNLNQNVLNVENDSPHVLEADDNRHLFRLLGEMSLPTRQLGLPNAANTVKYICYMHRRSNAPGHFAGATGQMQQEHQFDIGHGRTRVPAVFCKYAIRSGFKDMDAVQICYKENTSLSIKDNDGGLNLSLRTQDRLKSKLSGMVDLAFKFKSVSLTSADLLAIPERTGSNNELQPVLSSYNLPTIFEAGVKASGEVTSFSSTPYGTITFSEGGARRYHKMSPIPGGLRQFTIKCVFDPKDDKIAKTAVKLPPSGRFSCQLLFVRKK